MAATYSGGVTEPRLGDVVRGVRVAAQRLLRGEEAPVVGAVVAVHPGPSDGTPCFLSVACFLRVEPRPAGNYDGGLSRAVLAADGAVWQPTVVTVEAADAEKVR